MNDIENKAVAQRLAIPPALLEEIADGNEEALTGAARVQLAYIMEHMTHRCVDPATSPSAVGGIMEVLRKMSQGQKVDANLTGGPQVVINITRARDRENQESREVVVIEGKSTEIPALDSEVDNDEEN